MFVWSGRRDSNPASERRNLPWPFLPDGNQETATRPRRRRGDSSGTFGPEANTNTDTLLESFGQSRFFDRFESYTAHNPFPHESAQNLGNFEESANRRGRRVCGKVAFFGFEHGHKHGHVAAERQGDSRQTRSMASVEGVGNSHNLFRECPGTPGNSKAVRVAGSIATVDRVESAKIWCARCDSNARPLAPEVHDGLYACRLLTAEPEESSTYAATLLAVLEWFGRGCR